MTLDEMTVKAKERVLRDNPDAKGLVVHQAFENILDGTVVRVEFVSENFPKDSNHVWFSKTRDEVRTYRWAGDVLNAVSASRERNWFFRFLEFAGVGGLIALILILVFSFLLLVFAFSTTNANSTVVEVVKSSFATILGYFFGSQVSAKK